MTPNSVSFHRSSSRITMPFCCNWSIRAAVMRSRFQSALNRPMRLRMIWYSDGDRSALGIAWALVPFGDLKGKNSARQAVTSHHGVISARSAYIGNRVTMVDVRDA